LGKDQIQQLILEAKQGNQLAFNQLLNEYWDQVYHFHLSRKVDPFDAEDLCIQTFAKAFDKLDRYDSNFQFNTWLITISKNLHIDLLRSRKKGEIFDAFIEENSEVIDDSTTLEEREADEIQDRQLKAGIEKLTLNTKLFFSCDTLTNYLLLKLPIDSINLKETLRYYY
jgi:RNA polymerase sigma factor (sigma-70 family)